MPLTTTLQPHQLPRRALIYCPYGDSIAYGSNASPRLTARWSTLLGSTIRTLGRVPAEQNASVAGALVVDVLSPAFDSYVLIYNPALVILAGGLNDMRKGTAVETFTTSYNAMVAEAVAYASVQHVICCSLVHITNYSGYAPYNLGDDTANHAYNAAIAAIATANGAQFADIHGGMNHNDSLVDTDGIHPNNAGHANIAATVAAVLAGLTF